jgi:cysteinyl-tRNA synthetase
MSKSLGNYILARDLLKKYDPTVIRLFLANSHYRKQVDFNQPAIKHSQRLLDRINRTLELIENSPGGNGNNLDIEIIKFEKEFIKAMEDDLNTVLAIKSIMRFIKQVNASLDNKKPVLDSVKEKILELIGILGIDIDSLYHKEKYHELAISLIDLLIMIRKDLREAEMYQLSDRIRTRLTGLGVILEDKADETLWRFNKKNSSKA